MNSIENTLLTEFDRFLFERLPERLRSLGVPKSIPGFHPNGYSQVTLDPEGVIADIQMILRLGVKYKFESLTAIIKSTVELHAVGTPSALSDLIERMKSQCNEKGDHYEVRRTEWRTPLTALLDLAHEHKIHTMLPGIYFLFLALDGPTKLARNSQIWKSDRLRCSSGFYALHRNICKLGSGKVQQLHGDDYDHQALWVFSDLTVSEQGRVWESLPSIFLFEGWKMLRTRPKLDVRIF